MCKFCKNVVTGDDLHYILDLESEGDISADVATYLCYKKPYPVLETVVNLMYKPILVDSVTVTFCPMCGCNLRKAIEERTE